MVPPVEVDQLEACLSVERMRSLFGDRQQLFPEVRAMIGSGEAGGFEEQQIQFHMRVDLPCDNLFKVDRMSMAHGLEVRVPMLDNAAYSTSLPHCLSRCDREGPDPRNRCEQWPKVWPRQ